jgi:hypothetical protein
MIIAPETPEEFSACWFLGGVVATAIIMMRDTVKLLTMHAKNR